MSPLASTMTPVPPRSIAGPLDVRAGERLAVAIVIPCFNEAESLPTLFAALEQAAVELGDRYACECLFVDDASTDDTPAMLAAACAAHDGWRVVRHRTNRGVSAAIMTGIQAATCELVCSIDADGTYTLDHLRPLLDAVADGADLATASPYHPQGRVLSVPRWRLALSKCASLLYRRALRTKLHTYTACVRAYRRSAVVDVELEQGGFVGTAELLWRLDRRGARIVERPAVLDVRKYGQSKMKVARAVRGHLRLAFRAAWDRVTRRREP